MLLRTSYGAIIDATEEHAAKLLEAGWQRVATEEPEPQEVDLTALTVATLRNLCDERGIEAPKRATKAQLIALLTE